MSITKLISQGKAYDELFDTADYIQTDDGVGIYPAYENSLRDSIAYSNISNMVEDEGYFTINVPGASTLARFRVALANMPQDMSYDVYFESSIVLDRISVADATTLYYNNTEPTLTESFEYTVANATETLFNFYPFSGDLDAEILIKYTVVPKGYPKVQENTEGELTGTISADLNSYSFQFKNFNYGNGIFAPFLVFEFGSVDRFLFASRTDPTLIALSIRSDDVGGTPVTYNFNIDSAITISMLGNVLSVYENGVLGAVVNTTWSSKPTSFVTSNIDSQQISTDIPFIGLDTAQATGYSQGSEPSIQPTCKLGLAGAEIDLPKESRVQSSINRVVKELESESANATLHTQFIATKDRLAVSYDVISEENRKIIKDIEALQWQNNTRLSYIYNEESGNLITKTVKATVKTGGNKILRDRYFDSGLTVEMKE
jgi:hypothetical protein